MAPGPRAQAMLLASITSLRSGGREVDRPVLYYGAKGSVRTDVILRDDAGQVIAIYDVKTGNATIGAVRAAELRTKVGVDNTVPIIELQAIHGVDRKGLISRATADDLRSYSYISENALRR